MPAVLSLTGKRRGREAPSDDPADRTGMFTTGIVAVVGDHRIALYFTDDATSSTWLKTSRQSVGTCSKRWPRLIRS
jgi:hypothetical protein